MKMERKVKKIVMYIDVMYRGGAQRVMANLAAYFVQRGVEVTLVNDFVPQQDVLVYEVPKEVKRVYLRQQVEGNPLVKNLERVKELRRILQTEQPDIALSFLGRPNLRMLLASKGLPCKTIVSVRNDPNREYGASKAKKLLARHMFKGADGCVFQTHEAAEYFPASVQARSRIIMNPVADSFFAKERQQETHHVITVGRFAPQKNHKLLIEAFAKIADDFPAENLMIYGEATGKQGTAKQELEACIQSNHLEGRVLLPGNIPNVAEKLAACKVFVLSSDFEGMPNALLEAMAVGAPVVSTDCPCGGPREVIRDGENGRIVPCRDAQALADAMADLLRDPVRASQMGAAARETTQHFRPEEVYAQWEQYFSEIYNEK